MVNILHSTLFDSFYKKLLSLFSNRKLKVAQIWSDHRSTYLIFYFGLKKFGVGFLKILWETDKLHFTSSNWVCVYKPNEFQNMKFSLYMCFRQNFQKSKSQFFLCQNRKSELSIDGLIIFVPLLTFGLRKTAKGFCKMSPKV